MTMQMLQTAPEHQHATPTANTDTAPAQLAQTCRFDLVGTPDAGLLPRALDTVARLDIAPMHCTANNDTHQMTVCLVYQGLTAAQAQTAAARMRNIWGVHNVALTMTQHP
jgi:hypothetical protein